METDLRLEASLKPKMEPKRRVEASLKDRNGVQVAPGGQFEVPKGVQVALGGHLGGAHGVQVAKYLFTLPLPRKTDYININKLINIKLISPLYPSGRGRA